MAAKLHCGFFAHFYLAGLCFCLHVVHLSIIHSFCSVDKNCLQQFNNTEHCLTSQTKTTSFSCRRVYNGQDHFTGFNYFFPAPVYPRVHCRTWNRGAPKWKAKLLQPRTSKTKPIIRRHESPSRTAVSDVKNIRYAQEISGVKNMTIKVTAMSQFLHQRY